MEKSLSAREQNPECLARLGERRWAAFRAIPGKVYRGFPSGIAWNWKPSGPVERGNPLWMSRRDELALHESPEDRFGAGHELPAASFAGSLPGCFSRWQDQDGQCLVRFPNQRDDLAAWSFEIDPPDIQRNLKCRKRSNDTFNQRRMAAEEALLRIRRILEIGGKQEKQRFLQVARCQRIIPSMSIA